MYAFPAVRDPNIPYRGLLRRNATFTSRRKKMLEERKKNEFLMGKASRDMEGNVWLTS